MKQAFKAKNGYLQSIIYFLLTVGILGFFVITSGQALDWTNPLLTFGTVVVFIAFIFMSNRGALELDNGVLSRKRFLIRWWSVNVSSITDILQGNTMSNVRARAGGGSYSSRGLSFRDAESKFYQIPYDLVDQNSLINTLKQIQPSIQYHSDVTEFLITLQLTGNVQWSGSGWKGDTRLKKTKIFVFIIALIGVAVLAIVSGLK